MIIEFIHEFCNPAAAAVAAVVTCQKGKIEIFFRENPR
jgi:hypothetical protein